MSECVTHHPACECREARLAALEDVAAEAEMYVLFGPQDDSPLLNDLRDALARLDAVTGGETS